MNIGKSLIAALAAGLLALTSGIQPARSADLTAQPGYMKGEFIFDSAPFPSCHASTIVETTNGLVTAWFGGTEEKNPDVGIWLSHHVEGHWTAPQEVANGVQADGRRHPCWNPVLFQPRTGPLLLFYKVGPSPSTWWGMMRTSTDQGRTWSEGRRLPEGFLGPIKNKPVQLPDGDILCPSSSEHDGWRVHFERTDVALSRWQMIGPVNDPKEFGAIQPSLLFLDGGRIEAVGRTQNKHLFQIWSEDGGQTWGKMTALPLPNPDAGSDAVTLADGRLLLVYNHTARGRTPLNVSVSANGTIWQGALVLEAEPGEYSYPAVIQTQDRMVHITYTWKRKRIKHVVLNPDQMVLRTLPGEKWPR